MERLLRLARQRKLDRVGAGYAVVAWLVVQGASIALPAFDAAPYDLQVDGTDVLLLSPVDPFYGIQVKRRIHVPRSAPEMEITTTYERVNGAPSKVGIWIITQFREPERVHEWLL